jgi:secondary thiamine-phosphate synthase enzyme
MLTISIRTHEHAQFVNITREVQAAANKLGIANGILTTFIPHTTAGITINENADPDVTADMIEALEKAVPWNAAYKHSEGNAAAHLKASMMGSSVQIIVEEGRLALGTWQAIYFCEFDGPRTRNIQIAGSKA